MVVQDRESRSLEGDKGRVGESYSAAAVSGGNGGSTGGASSRKMGGKFEAPTCTCGDYAILFLSKTSSNPNRLFFGCQHFKTKGANCRYFEWLDEYVDCFHENKAGNSTVAANPMERIEQRIASIEIVLMARDAGGSKFREIVIFLLGVVVAFCCGGLFSA